jgi:hypothetical protein
MSKPFDQPELWNPHDVGCTYFGRDDTQRLLILNKPIKEEQCAFDYYVNEAIDLNEGNDIDSQHAIARLQQFKERVDTLKLVASCVENDNDNEYKQQTDFYEDDKGWIWADGHGDDTDSSVYVARFAPSIGALLDLWFRYCASKTLQQMSFHTLIFEATWRLEMEQIEHPQSNHCAVLEHWSSLVTALRINMDVVGLSQICCGAHPMSGRGPDFIHRGPVVVSDGEEW